MSEQSQSFICLGVTRVNVSVFHSYKVCLGLEDRIDLGRHVLFGTSQVTITVDTLCIHMTLVTVLAGYTNKFSNTYISQ